MASRPASGGDRGRGPRRAAGAGGRDRRRRARRQPRRTARCWPRPRAWESGSGSSRRRARSSTRSSTGGRPAGETDELWRRLGEAEFQAGRDLDDLRAAFRTGIRAAWRGAADLALRAGVSAQIAIAIAEAIFVYGDELATDVVEGYLRMQSDEAGERERRRRRLAQLLLDPAGHDPEALAAGRASWRAGRCRARWRSWRWPPRARSR